MGSGYETEGSGGWPCRPPPGREQRRVAWEEVTDHDGLTRRSWKEVGVERLLLTAEETAEMLGIGRTKVYELMRLGLIESVKIPGCRRIPTAAVRDYVDRLRRDSVACASHGTQRTSGGTSLLMSLLALTASVVVGALAG